MDTLGFVMAAVEEGGLSFILLVLMIVVAFVAMMITIPR
jgi:hypothetical protein